MNAPYITGPPDTATLAGYECRLRSVQISERPVQPRSVRLYEIASPERYIDRDRLLRDADVEDPPYWALVWIGARAIAAHLTENPPPRGARVCDLGCGLGLAGLTAALYDARGTFCDIVEAAWIEEGGRPERTWLHRLRRPM